MKSITETSILSVLLGGIVENAFEENVLLRDGFSLSRCNRVFLGFDESIDRSKIFVCVCAWKCERRIWYEEVSVFSKNVKNARFSRFRIYVVLQALGFMSASVILPSRITFLLRTANRVGEDSYCVARYCTHSGCSFSCATRTASSSHGALAVSCKYCKQSKSPFSAAH